VLPNTDFRKQQKKSLRPSLFEISMHYTHVSFRSFVRFHSLSYLHGNDGRQKDIVQCLGFHAHIELLDTEAESSDQLFHGTDDKAKTRLGQAVEFAPTFNDADLGRANGKTAGNAHGVVD
jgi:hypothetical protein